MVIGHGQSAKLTYCGAEVTITYEQAAIRGILRGDFKPILGTITFSAF